MATMGQRLRWCVVALVTAVGLGLGSVVLVGPAAANDRHPAVLWLRVIGHTVKDRKIYAFRLGSRHADTSVVALAAMHGDENAPQWTLRALRNGRRIRGVELWVIPSMNPDGVARGTRTNAHGVDLNRNFPTNWKWEGGTTYSGPRPASEPETRALMRFLDDVRPDYVVSFHQPLYGVDTNGSKAPRFARRLARDLRLPRKDFDCGGGCHGTLTQWFDRHHRGAAVTVEYKQRPHRHYVRTFAPRGLLHAIGGHRVPATS